MRFFLDRSWTGNANEQPISPPADGRHVPLGRGRCKHYRNIGRSCAVIIGSRFLDKGLQWIGIDVVRSYRRDTWAHAPWLESGERRSAWFPRSC